MTAFVNHDNKIIFVHTPKTGGTSITDCMVGLSNLAQAEAVFGIPTKNIYYWDDDEGHATCKNKEKTTTFSRFVNNFYETGECLQSHWFTNDGKIDVKIVIDFENLSESLHLYFELTSPLRKINTNNNQRKNGYHYESKEVIKKATELLRPDLDMYEQLFAKRWQPC